MRKLAGPMAQGRARPHQRPQKHHSNQDTYPPIIPPAPPRIPPGHPQIWSSNQPIHLFWLQNRFTHFQEGSLGRLRSTPVFVCAPWDTSKTARDEKQSRQQMSRMSIVICHDARFGRCTGTPPAPTKTENTLPECSKERPGAKTTVF